MSEYHKIQSIFKRDMTSPRKTLIEGAWTLPEFEYLAGNVLTYQEIVDMIEMHATYNIAGWKLFGVDQITRYTQKAIVAALAKLTQQEPVAIVTGHTLDGPMLVWTGEGVHVGDSLYTRPIPSQHEERKPRDYLSELGFMLEDRGGCWVVVDDCGGVRPANLTECVLWDEVVKKDQQKRSKLYIEREVVEQAQKALLESRALIGNEAITDTGREIIAIARTHVDAATDRLRAALSAAAELVPAVPDVSPAAPQGEAVADRAFLERMLVAMEGVVDVADRKTDEFDKLRECIMDLTLTLYKNTSPKPAAVAETQGERAELIRALEKKGNAAGWDDTAIVTKDLLRQAAALLSAGPARVEPLKPQQAAPGAVVEGWQMVPVIPTVEMKAAGAGIVNGFDFSHACYSAMLRAAPKPQGE